MGIFEHFCYCIFGKFAKRNDQTHYPSFAKEPNFATLGMNESIIHIKNMVCPRCITAVKEILDGLKIQYQNIELGQVVLPEPIDKNHLKIFENKINSLGFELLEPGKSSLISKIKTVIIDQIHYNKEPISINFSSLIGDKLHHDYSYLSRLFSSVEGVTIEKFIVRQKIEKVKELLFYDELSLSEIAFKMDYSSVAYLSTQFKKETGMTPTQFKNTHQPGHRHLDSL
jgi:AraC-like DNA-binding protein